MENDRYANLTLDEKIELGRRPDIDVRELFTPEDVDELCCRSEFFSGSVADLTKVERHKKLSEIAKWLAKNSQYVKGVEIEPVSRKRPNAIVSVDIGRVVMLHDQTLEAFKAMMLLCDDLSVSALAGDSVRFSFGVQKIWQ